MALSPGLVAHQQPRSAVLSALQPASQPAATRPESPDRPAGSPDRASARPATRRSGTPAGGQHPRSVPAPRCASGPRTPAHVCAAVGDWKPEGGWAPSTPAHVCARVCVRGNEIEMGKDLLGIGTSRGPRPGKRVPATSGSRAARPCAQDLETREPQARGRKKGRRNTLRESA